ncbi:hypothetical protein MJD09_05075 [bacterium]|nr:hypothetical protein [bacterium]
MPSIKLKRKKKFFYELPVPNKQFLPEKYKESKISRFFYVSVNILLIILSCAGAIYSINVAGDPVLRNLLFGFALFVAIERISTLITWLDHRDRIHHLVDETLLPALAVLMKHDAYVEKREIHEKSLNTAQLYLKETLLNDVRIRHYNRIMSIEINRWARMYDFSIMFEYLFKFVFNYGTETPEGNTVMDYSVSWNADAVFRRYSFEDYFDNVLDLFEQHGSDEITIYFLICVDFKEENSDAREGGTYILPPEYNEDAAKQFEKSFEALLKRLQKKFKLNRNASPKEVWDIVSTESPARRVCVRLINRSQIEHAEAVEFHEVQQPFNVYSDVAVSRTMIRSTSTGYHPIPHLEVSLNPRHIQEQAKKFDEMWKKTGDTRSDIFVDDDKFDESFGRANLVRRWIALRNR